MTSILPMYPKYSSSTCDPHFLTPSPSLPTRHLNLPIKVFLLSLSEALPPPSSVVLHLSHAYMIHACSTSFVHAVRRSNITHKSNPHGASDHRILDHQECSQCLWVRLVGMPFTIEPTDAGNFHAMMQSQYDCIIFGGHERVTSIAADARVRACMFHVCGHCGLSIL